jgi:hypothetical protein
MGLHECFLERAEFIAFTRPIRKYRARVSPSG